MQEIRKNTLRKLIVASVISKDEVVSNKKLKRILGGYGNDETCTDSRTCSNDRTLYCCNCKKSTGQWTACFYSQSDAEADGANWCASGIAECYAM